MIPIVSIFTILTSVYTKNHCSIDINSDFGKISPLVLQDTSPGAFLEPINDAGTLTIAAGKAIRLACMGARNYLVNVNRNNTNDVRAVCINDKMFQVGSSKFNISSLVCSYSSEHKAKITKDRCLGKYTKIEIGFELTDGFLRVFEICHNNNTHTTYYAMVHMNKAIGNYQSGYSRPKSWMTDNFYKYDMDNLYERKTQIKTIENCVNSRELAEHYIKTNDDFYYSRGHLVAKGDLVYGVAQRTTFRYLNSAPQWQSFNGGNWNELEQDVRSFVVNNNLNVQIYTGVHGQQTLADRNGVPKNIFFYATKNVRDLIVPKYFWKFIYDPVSKKGTAFVGLNDPHTDYKENPICKDISKNIRWLSWHADNIKLGISYACRYEDLRKAIPTIPVLEVTDILV